MRPQNPFYNQCKYLRYIYPKTSSINAYSVVAWCEKFMINIYILKDNNGSQKILACVNNSPYLQESTCKGFEHRLKHRQSRLF
jgi:uncharacterized membrane protein